jgi:hypothetical protein
MAIPSSKADVVKPALYLGEFNEFFHQTLLISRLSG